MEKEHSQLSNFLIAPQIPTSLVIVVIAITLSPIVLLAFGVQFGMDAHLASTHQLALLPDSDLVNNIHLMMVGSQLHTLLEWCAIVIAVLTAVLAFSQFGLTGNITTPVLGVSLLSAGVMDAFHSLAAVRLLDTVANSSELVPFSWAVARTFNASILLLGASALLLPFGNAGRRNPFRFILIIAGTMAFLGYIVIQWSISSSSIPVSIFPADIVKRPFDVIPLIIYILCGAFVFPVFKNKYPSIFADALILSMLPAVAVEMHMVFGSAALYDNHFMAAHFLKVIAYVVPFLGLLLDYSRTYRKDAMRTQQLHQTYRDLETRTQQLIKSNKTLEKSNQYKSEFMAGMSHELRTPLNSVIGFSRILLKDFSEDDGSRAYRAVVAIFRNSTHLLGLINDILDLSKIDAGRMSVTKTEFLISDVISEVKNQLTPLADEKKLEFNLINYARNVCVVSDEVKMKQIFLNLGSNAVKYTDRGSVTISVEREKGGPLGSAIKITFKDTGIGIADNDKPKLFTEFGRAEDVLSRSIEGTGLGLMITEKLTHFLGGYLEFDSEFGVGSEFRVYFPMGSGSVDNEKAADQGQWDRKGLAVVYIDSDVDMLAFMALSFCDTAVKVFTVSDPCDAMKMCEDVLPDAICFEPEMSGGLLRELYGHTLMHDVPKVAISSLHEKKKMILAEGADAFIAKPCEGQDLLKKITHLSYRGVASILLVGVEAAHALVLCEAFESHYIQPFFAEDDKEALEKLSKFLPDVVLINLGKPSVEVARLEISMNNDEKYRRLPQILYNGLDQPRKLVLGNDIQEELRVEEPECVDILEAVFTIKRRGKTSLMRIEALNRSLKAGEAEAQNTLPVVDSEYLTIEHSKRLLIVEDSKDNMELLCWILDDAGIDHDDVFSGREALKCVLQKKYDLILLDINLPDISGREVARRLRATNTYRHTPIVAVTVHSGPADKVGIEESGINAIIAKPVDQEKLLTVVNHFLAAN